MADWREALILAAAKRARVRLVDGSEGVLVYAPGTRKSINDDSHEPRHGDRTKCGVRFGTDSWVTAVEPTDIIEVLP